MSDPLNDMRRDNIYKDDPANGDLPRKETGLKVKDLIAALDGVDPEAHVVLDYSAGEEAWIVDGVEKGYVTYPPIRGHYCDYSVPEQWADDNQEENLSKAFLIRAG